MFIEFIPPLCSTYNSYTRQVACKSDFACTYLTCMRASATCLVRTRVLCTRVSTSSIMQAHACLHACEMKSVSCRVEYMPHACLVKFKLSCTIYKEVEMSTSDLGKFLECRKCYILFVTCALMIYLICMPSAFGHTYQANPSCPCYNYRITYIHMYICTYIYYNHWHTL